MLPHDFRPGQPCISSFVAGATRVVSSPGSVTCAASSMLSKDARSSPAPWFSLAARQSSFESGSRAGYDGYKLRNGCKVHMAVDTLCHLIALTVTPANEQERSQVKQLCEAVQGATGEAVDVAWAD